jgi:Tfp pilus assembly protein PilZ
MASVRKRRATAPARPSVTMERRSSGLLRVPFIRRCRLEFSDGRAATAFLVNINVLGAYVAEGELPRLGQKLICHFGLPGTEREVVVNGVVAWVNARQQHPVHSLPPGFGVKFLDLSGDVRRDIERVIEEYVAGRGRR